MYNKPMASAAHEDRAQRLSRGSGARISLAREVVTLRDDLEGQGRDWDRQVTAMREELQRVEGNRDMYQRESTRLQAALNAAHKKDRLHREHRDHLMRVLVSIGKDLTVADDMILFPEMEIEG